MVRLELSDNEARILAHILERASDEFSNHGCNDFDLTTELGLDESTAKAVGQELLRAMVKNGTADEGQLESSGRYLYDWQLYTYFRKRVQEAT